MGNDPVKKMDKETEETFFQRRHLCGQEVYEKVLNITNHREMQMKATVRYHPIHFRTVAVPSPSHVQLFATP